MKMSSHLFISFRFRSMDVFADKLKVMKDFTILRYLMRQLLAKKFKIKPIRIS